MCNLFCQSSSFFFFSLSITQRIVEYDFLSFVSSDCLKPNSLKAQTYMWDALMQDTLLPKWEYLFHTFCSGLRFRLNRNCIAGSG